MKILPPFRQLFDGFVHLLYPELCAACQSEVPFQDHCFCLRCQAKVAPSDMYRVQENEFVERFWGRLPLLSGASAYYFVRDSPIRRAVHLLKYKNQPQIGRALGRAFGQKLRETAHYQSVECIVPVPLHPKKERLRGYNQSAVFAQGLAGAMGVPVFDKALARISFTETQTRKKRMDRFENVGDVFVVVKPALLQGKHVLLADDVLTTGATLEMCGLAILLGVPGTQLSCVTIGIASR